MTLRQELEQLQSRSQTLLQRAPVWLAAQSSLNQLSEQCGETFESSRVTEYLQQLLEREREAIVERDEVGARKREVDEEIELKPAGRCGRCPPEYAGGAFRWRTAVRNL